MKRSENPCSSWSTRIISFFSMTSTVVGAIVVAVAMQMDRPVMHPSPKKSPYPRIATTAPLPVSLTTESFNDSLGHAVGDKLLQSVSSRLLANVRGSDTVSRLGGDEFVILLSEITCPEDAATSAKRILLSLNAPHFIGGQDLIVNGSIGISVYPEDGED